MIEGLTHLAGWLAIALLVASLALSLAARWRRRIVVLREHHARLVSLRRLAGLGGAALAAAHATLGLGVLGAASLDEVLAMLSGVPYLRHGALAIAVLAPLALTSFPTLNARLGLRTWSTLHRGVYVAVALAALHVLAGPSADPRLATAIAFVIAALLLARLWPERATDRASAERAGDAEPLTTESADNP